VRDADHLDGFPFPILIGDIGGTNARFAIVRGAAAPVVPLPPKRTADHPTLDDAIAAALADGKARPKSALLAVAAPIVGEELRLTNWHWVVSPARLVERFGLSELALLNDFEAQALSLPDLTGDDLDRIGGGTTDPGGPRVVVGPGTGLGVAALVRAGEMWVPVPGQGGHVDLGPQTERDLALWPQIERPHGRMEAETILCGSGLVRLYRAICMVDGVTPQHHSPSDLRDAALAGGDPQAREVLDLFAAYLGRISGDLALTFLATGGVYLGGGIPRKVSSILKAGGFREAFEAKAPHGELLRNITTSIIARSDAALAGVAALARDPARFGVDLAGRTWQA
jgi:glucokinase